MSIDNLKKSFSGESETNRRYLAFAKKAEKEGFPQIAKLFCATAEAETVHAFNHLRIIGEIKSTLENLETAISSESSAYKERYPIYLKIAKEEKNELAAWSFELAGKVEKIHYSLFAKAIDALKSSSDLTMRNYYVCNNCGNTVENRAPNKCDVCSALKEKFFKID